jgi:hypothetical protein
MFNSIFQPDTLLPAQYLETVCSTALPEAEKKLLLAVLEDAISCFRDNISTFGIISPHKTKGRRNYSVRRRNGSSYRMMTIGFIPLTASARPLA